MNNLKPYDEVNIDGEKEGTTLREYMQNLLAFAEANPEALDMVVVYANDDEGNGFCSNLYDPSMGKFEDDDYLPLSDDCGVEKGDCNAVCIN